MKPIRSAHQGEPPNPAVDSARPDPTPVHGGGLIDRLVGKAKRAVGELTGRPDMVLEGEAQDRQINREEFPKTES